MKCSICWDRVLRSLSVKGGNLEDAVIKSDTI